MKSCKICNETKGLSEFYKQKGCADGCRNSCKSCDKKRVTANKLKNPDIEKRYRLKNIDILRQKEKERSSNQRKTNLLKIKENRAKWVSRNQELNRDIKKSWRLNNKSLINFYSAKRRALKITSSFAGFDNQIKKIYDSCPSGYHVDHIVPLRGKNVCGLHVPWNLQHLPAQDNLIKSNKVI